MIYKQCIDACLDAVKACDRYAFEECKGSQSCEVGSGEEGKGSKDCVPGHCESIICADVCTLVGRLTAKGLCYKELYELCAKACEDCAEACKDCDNDYAKDCVAACKKCAEACRKCQEDCKTGEVK